MTDEPATPRDPDTPLRPATYDELQDSLSFALRFDGRKRAHTGDEMMARITVDRLIEHLRRSGFVVMKAPSAPPHSTPAGPPRAPR